MMERPTAMKPSNIIVTVADDLAWLHVDALDQVRCGAARRIDR